MADVRPYGQMREEGPTAGYGHELEVASSGWASTSSGEDGCVVDLLDPILEQEAPGAPMSAQTYKAVMSRSGKFSGKPRPKDHEFHEEEFALRQDLAYGKLRWYGNWLEDLWCFLRNNNPVFSICYSHPLHPISRSERYFIYGTMVIFKVLLACACQEGQACLYCNLTTCRSTASGCSHVSWAPMGHSMSDLTAAARTLHWRRLSSSEGSESLNEDISELLNESVTVQAVPDGNASNASDPEHGLYYNPNATEDSKIGIDYLRSHPGANYCCVCKRMGVIWFLETFGAKLGSMLYCLVFGATYAIVMFQMVACACAQKFEASKKRRRCEEGGYFVVGCVTLLLVVFVLPKLVWYCLLNDMLLTALMTFVKAQAISWLGTIFFAPGMAIFSFLYWKEKRQEKKGELRWHVTWQEWRDWEDDGAPPAPTSSPTLSPRL
eukprot:TRINITY_DN54505_c0_g1_i1.p1 TRINITY_DN54505_c0_g1~~TRINITY_DN54505_c0_g1_i1.p1  ORF type:complete len:436 (-),score=76.37 TRINITY_DN54505_c0_g1_i1:199-1506(-)